MKFKLISFALGMSSLFLLMKFPEFSGSTFAYVELVIFAIAFILGCSINPSKPFIVASFIVLGVFFGIIIDLIIHPTYKGFDRNLAPFEVVIHTTIAFISCGLCASSWYIIKKFLLNRGSRA